LRAVKAQHAAELEQVRQEVREHITAVMRVFCCPSPLLTRTIAAFCCIPSNAPGLSPTTSA
jgi:hypothetical protein